MRRLKLAATTTFAAIRFHAPPSRSGSWDEIPGSTLPRHPGMTVPLLITPPLNPSASCRDPIKGNCEPNISSMKIALFALLGLVLGILGGAALGIGLGLAWIEIFKTTDFEGYSGMLVFFTFMPAGAMIGGLGGAFLFGLLAFRDHEIAIEREQGTHRE
jgi:hypothetical protein